MGIHSRKTSQIYNFKTTLGGEICFCDVNMHIGKFTALHSALFSELDRALPPVITKVRAGFPV